MRSRLRFTWMASLAIVLLFMLSATSSRVTAATTTTLLPTEDFSGGIPGTWTDNSYGYWYSSSNGNGDYNGSAVMDFWDCGTGELQTPSFDGSAYSAVGDTAFVDFDLWLEADYWDVNYGGADLVVYAYGSAGQSKLMTVNTAKDFTFDNSSSYSWYYDPDITSTYWRHYHLGIASGQRSAGMYLGFSGENNNACGGNAAIDNVTVTGTHYNRISYTPASLSFGTLSTGSTSGQKTIVISNPNPMDISISGLGLSGAAAADYTIVHAPSTLSAGTAASPFTDSIVITFSPTSAGTRNAAVSFSDNSDGPTFVSVSLTGNGVAPVIAVAPTILFQGVHAKLGSSVDQFVIVTASGAGFVSVSPSSFFSGDFPGEYQIVKLPAGPIPSGQTDTIWVRYNPTMQGSRPAILNIVNNAQNGTQKVTLKGVGILGQLVVTPSPLNFDSVAIGQTKCMDVTLYNPGTDTVAITHDYFASADADFQLTALTHEDTLIPPEKSKVVTVCFTPIRNGLREARFRVTTNIPLTFESPKRDTSSFFINIMGVGVPSGSLAVDGSAVVDSAVVGQQICRTDTFYNRGSADLTITSATIMGTDAADYTLSGVTLPLTIQAGGSQVFSICATPSQRGDRNASLAISGMTNGSAINASLPLDVYGQLVCASASPQTAFTSKTCVGMTDTSWVTVSNCGDVAATYTAAITGATAPYHIVGSATSALTGPGGTATFGVVYAPTGRTADNAMLNITAANGINQAVTLTGAGQAATIAGADSAMPTRVAETSPTFTVTLNNSGECDWVPGVPSVSNTEFAYVSGGTTAIPPGGTGTITMTFSPTAQYEQTATLSFPNASEPSVPAPAVTVNGYGLSQAGVARVTEAEGYSLKQNYPNPFNPTTEIRFVLPKDGQVRLDIIDVTGKLVRTVLDQRMSAGEHGTVVNASDLASGAYYYQLKAGSIVLSRQMILSK